MFSSLVVVVCCCWNRSKNSFIDLMLFGCCCFDLFVCFLLFGVVFTVDFIVFFKSGGCLTFEGLVVVVVCCSSAFSIVVVSSGVGWLSWFICGFGLGWLVWFRVVGWVVWFTSGWLVGNFKVVCFNLGLWLVEVWFRVKVRFYS